MDIISLLLAKYKIFVYGFITGAVLQYFEIQTGNVKFNIGRFIISCIIFGVLTEFAHLLILGDFVNTSNNESRIIVVSIMIASFFYLFIPFVLKPENRGQFIESILLRFGFQKKNDKENILNSDLFK